LVRGLAAARKNMSRKNMSRKNMSRKNMSGKIMSAFDVAVQPEHVTDKEYIGTLLAQIKAQQETYNILYNRNLVLYNELKTMNAKPPASALEALKTLADRRGLQLRCEDELIRRHSKL
jgi:hypothetical protein